MVFCEVKNARGTAFGAPFEAVTRHEATSSPHARAALAVGAPEHRAPEVVRQMFPEMNIARLDRDTTRRRGSFEQIIMEFAGGGIDLLSGTQMIAKGHDFHNVTLVGVVSVDIGLALPDFRAAEHTFQLLTQVAGRAGRGDRPGRVIIRPSPGALFADMRRVSKTTKSFIAAK